MVDLRKLASEVGRKEEEKEGEEEEEQEGILVIRYETI